MTTNALFVGHGSPMNALEDNQYTRTWNSLGKDLAPRAILSISAHWFTRGTGVTAMTNPRTIHDFWGFPPELFEVAYDAPGDPEIAELVRDIAKPTPVLMDQDWGLDHGTWSVLKHMYPEASIPVVQLSIDATKPIDEHVELGAKLAQLAKEGVLIVGSGNVVHNLSLVDWNSTDKGEAWADSFDETARDIMLEDPSRVASLTEHPDFLRAVPTPDHFLPLAYIAGVAAATNGSVDVFNDQRTMGSLSMTGYQVAS